MSYEDKADKMCKGSASMQRRTAFSKAQAWRSQGVLNPGKFDLREYGWVPGYEIESCETGEAGRPGTEQGLVCHAWNMVTVVVAVDRESMIAFAFWRHGGSVYGVQLRGWREERAQNYGNDFFHNPHKFWTSAKRIVGFQGKTSQ